MIYKKGSTAVIVSVILIALVIIAFAVILIIVIQNPSNSQIIEEENTLKLYLESRDIQTQEQIESEYVLTMENGTFLSQGKLDKDSLIEIKGISKEGKIIVYCFSENYYYSKNPKEFTQVEKDNNASKITCNQNPSGNIKVTHNGSLNYTENIIRFNITAQKYFQGLSAVLSWSSGIISVDFKDNKITCENELGWVNYSYYNATEKVIAYLPENHYFCGNEIQICSLIKDKGCTLKEDIPPRYSNLVDKTISTGKNLKPRESYELILYVKTEEIKHPNDFLQIIFYDKDLFYRDGQFYYSSQNGDINLGNPSDFVYKIIYQ